MGTLELWRSQVLDIAEFEGCAIAPDSTSQIDVVRGLTRFTSRIGDSSFPIGRHSDGMNAMKRS